MDPRFKAFSNPTQLLGIALEGAPKASRLLVALAPEPGLEQAFEGAARSVTVWHHDYSVAGQSPGHFGLAPPPGPFDAALYYLPKSRAYQAFGLDLALPQLAPGAVLIAAGPKQGGAASAAALLKERLGADLKKYSARHCVAWEAALPKAAPSFAPQAAAFMASGWGVQARILSYPGVFAHGRLDEGSAFLLQSADLSGKRLGKVLDWGCGCGALGILAGLAGRVESLTLADISAPALESARETLAANGVANARVLASDVFSGLEGEEFDFMLSNPPAHQGFDSDQGATEKFLTQAPSHLLPGGRVLLVANAHLPYLRMMNAIFKTTAVLAKNGRFQVIEAGV